MKIMIFQLCVRDSLKKRQRCQHYFQMRLLQFLPRSVCNRRKTEEVFTNRSLEYLFMSLTLIGFLLIIFSFILNSHQ